MIAIALFGWLSAIVWQVVTHRKIDWLHDIGFGLMCALVFLVIYIVVQGRRSAESYDQADSERSA